MLILFNNIMPNCLYFCVLLLYFIHLLIHLLENRKIMKTTAEERFNNASNYTSNIRDDYKSQY